jgi:hypothetical protein
MVFCAGVESAANPMFPYEVPSAESMINLMLDPARNTWSNGKISIRAYVALAGTSGATSLS